MAVYVWTPEGAIPLETSAIHVDTLHEVSYGASAGLSFKGTGDLIRELKHGFPMSAFDTLQSAMDVPAKTLAPVAGFSAFSVQVKLNPSPSASALSLPSSCTVTPASTR